MLEKVKTERNSNNHKIPPNIYYLHHLLGISVIAQLMWYRVKNGRILMTKMHM